MSKFVINPSERQDQEMTSLRTSLQKQIMCGCSTCNKVRMLRGMQDQPGLHKETLSKKLKHRAGEMVQRLRALDVLPEVLSSIPSNHMVAHNHL